MHSLIFKHASHHLQYLVTGTRNLHHSGAACQASRERRNDERECMACTCLISRQPSLHECLKQGLSHILAGTGQQRRRAHQELPGEIPGDGRRGGVERLQCRRQGHVPQVPDLHMSALSIHRPEYAMQGCMHACSSRADTPTSLLHSADRHDTQRLTSEAHACEPHAACHCCSTQRSVVPVTVRGSLMDRPAEICTTIRQTRCSGGRRRPGPTRQNLPHK